jgi:hypothetical protein
MRNVNLGASAHGENRMHHTDRNHARTLIRLLASFIAGVGLLCFTSLPLAHADSEEQCQHRIEQANHKLHDAIDHHGPTSHEADKARHDLQNEREKCWREHHKWWDADEHRWHDQQDWDQHPPDHP